MRLLGNGDMGVGTAIGPAAPIVQRQEACEPQVGGRRREDVGRPLNASGRVDATFDTLTGKPATVVSGVPCRYQWDLVDDVLVVTVQLQFRGVDAGVAADDWAAAIRYAWNRYQIVNPGTGEKVWLVFDPQIVETEGDHTIEVVDGTVLGAGAAATNARWPIDMPSRNAAHEFGHMIGSHDHYFTTLDWAEELFGPPVPWTGQMGASPTAVADRIHQALSTEQDRIFPIVFDLCAIRPSGTISWDLFHVARAYEASYGSDLITAMESSPRGGAAAALMFRDMLQPGGDIMGSSLAFGDPDPRDLGSRVLGAKPPSLTGFADLVGQARGGRWEVVEHAHVADAPPVSGRPGATD